MAFHTVNDHCRWPSTPSIIFVDEPTSWLDARAAAIVMRTVQNTVDTGHEIDIFEADKIDIFEAFVEVFV